MPHSPPTHTTHAHCAAAHYLGQAAVVHGTETGCNGVQGGAVLEAGAVLAGLQADNQNCRCQKLQVLGICSGGQPELQVFGTMSRALQPPRNNAAHTHTHTEAPTLLDS